LPEIIGPPNQINVNSSSPSARNHDNKRPNGAGTSNYANPDSVISRQFLRARPQWPWAGPFRGAPGRCATIAMSPLSVLTAAGKCTVAFFDIAHGVSEN
jgi:hypothetical protein